MNSKSVAKPVNNHIAEHHTINRRNMKSAGTLRHVLYILQTTINDSL